MWDTPISSASFLHFDLEMTGLDPNRDAIVEIAWIRERCGKVEERFASAIRVEVPSTPGALALHGLGPAPTSAPSFSDIADRVAQAFRDAIPVAHGADLDVAFLRRALGSADDPVAHVVDTLTLARRAIAASRYTLSSLSLQLGLAPRRWHRALEDAEGTRALFHRLLPEFDPPSARDLLQVRIGQRERVRVREVIAASLVRAASSSERVALIVRTPGRGAQRIEGTVERWTSPHVTVKTTEGSVRILRADRVLRIVVDAASGVP